MSDINTAVKAAIHATLLNHAFSLLMRGHATGASDEDMSLLEELYGSAAWYSDNLIEMPKCITRMAHLVADLEMAAGKAPMPTNTVSDVTIGALLEALTAVANPKIKDRAGD